VGEGAGSTADRHGAPAGAADRHGALAGAADRHGALAGAADPTRPWLIIQHVAHEGPGLIGDALGEVGHPVEVVRLDRGETLPGHQSLAGLVVLGGPMGVHDAAVHPWLVAERALIETCVDHGKPVLGVCLGAQQLAVALGAEVTSGPEPEIGLGQVVLTPAGRRDPVFGPEYGGLSATALPCVHWHQDTFSMPDGAVHLAGTRAFPHQAFRWGDNVYGLQFHVEVDGELAEAWRAHLPVGVTLNGARLVEVETVGRRLLRRFVELASTSAIPSGRPAARERLSG
jgi:GMP synthase (glutamine-hydrolysing)